MGRIIRSLAETMNKWTGSSKLKKLRKFIVTYCPEVMDNLEIMTGITENWRVYPYYLFSALVSRYRVHVEKEESGGE